MKIVNPGMEIRCLKSLCDGGPKLSARIINALGDESFHYEPTLEAWRRVRALIKSHGEVPSWDELCADPAINEAHRTALRKDQQKPLRAANEDRVASMLRLLDRYRQLRKLLTCAQEIMDAVEDESVDVDKLMDAANEHLLSARTKADAQKKLLHIGRGNNSTQMVKDLLSSRKRPVVPTGFKAFDDVNGGILLGSLFVIAANTGGGKSTMAINLAHNMANAGEDVCVVPLEMTEDQMAARLFGLRTGLDVGKISQHKLARGEKKKVAGDFKSLVSDLKEKETRISLFAPEEDMGIEDILLMLKPFRYRVIIIDYISLLKGADDDDQAKKLGAIARFAKVFAKNNNCVVILLAQLDDKTKNIRYARAIREHANNAWFWFMTEDEQETSIMEIRQVKARNQKRFPFSLLSHNASMLITDMDDEHRGQLDDPAYKKAKSEHDKHFKDLEEDEQEEDQEEYAEADE